MISAVDEIEKEKNETEETVALNIRTMPKTLRRELKRHCADIGTSMEKYVIGLIKAAVKN